MHMVGCVYAWNFGTKFFLRRGECKTRENSNFLKKGKIVISVKIRNFYRSRMTKRTFSLKSSHEIELPRRISLDSEVVGISRFSRRGVSDDTWQGKMIPYGTIRERHLAKPCGPLERMAHNEPCVGKGIPWPI